jgi:hypothetical protein
VDSADALGEFFGLLGKSTRKDKLFWQVVFRHDQNQKVVYAACASDWFFIVDNEYDSVNDFGSIQFSLQRLGNPVEAVGYNNFGGRDCITFSPIGPLLTAIEFQQERLVHQWNEKKNQSELLGTNNALGVVHGQLREHFKDR